MSLSPPLRTLPGAHREATATLDALLPFEAGGALSPHLDIDLLDALDTAPLLGEEEYTTSPVPTEEYARALRTLAMTDGVAATPASALGFNTVSDW